MNNGFLKSGEYIVVLDLVEKCNGQRKIENSCKTACMYESS